MNWFLFASVIAWAIAVASGLIAVVGIAAASSDPAVTKEAAVVTLISTPICVLTIATIAGMGMY